jgi:hypothetical protein
VEWLSLYKWVVALLEHGKEIDTYIYLYFAGAFWNCCMGGARLRYCVERNVRTCQKVRISFSEVARRNESNYGARTLEIAAYLQSTFKKHANHFSKL